MAEKTEEKSVDLFLGINNSTLVIKLKNSALSAPQKRDNQYISDKTEYGHGYGIRNVTNCIERLGGSFEINFSDGYVTVDIIIPNAITLSS